MTTPKLKQKPYETHPLILQRADAIPTYERNNLVFNYDTSVSQIKYIAHSLTQIENIKLDTFKEKNSFYSYRRSLVDREKDYGRCISVILMT